MVGRVSRSAGAHRPARRRAASSVGVAARGRALSALFAHVLSGLATLRFAFPKLPADARHRRIRRWSRRLLSLLSVELQVRGDASALAGPNRMLVANHVSWIDAFLVHAVHPACFVAKAEIRKWPALGALAAGAGTLFIERGRRRDVHRINNRIGEALAGGELVALFPEGTTGDGRSVRAFHASLLQAVIDRGGEVVPVALCYRSPGGERSKAVLYTESVTFVQSLMRILAEPRLVAEVTVLEPLPAQGRTRRELAEAARAAIRAALEQTAGATVPGTRSGLPGARR